jgi:hypothetical protein
MSHDEERFHSLLTDYFRPRPIMSQDLNVPPHQVAIYVPVHKSPRTKSSQDLIGQWDE